MTSTNTKTITLSGLLEKHIYFLMSGAAVHSLWTSLDDANKMLKELEERMPDLKDELRIDKIYINQDITQGMGTDDTEAVLGYRNSYNHREIILPDGLVMESRMTIQIYDEIPF